MSVDVRAPSEQSEGTRSQIVRWLKSAGESVARDEPLIEVETDKVTVEIAAPVSGVLREILKHEQEEIVPGELLGRIEPATAQASPAPPPHTSAAASPVAAGEPRTPEAATARVRTDAGARMSPAVRRLLGEHGLEPAAIRGSGEAGRITVDDVLLSLIHISEPTRP